MFSANEKVKSREIKIIKTLVLGEKGCGKTALINTYRGVKNEASSTFAFYNIVKSADIIHQIWDISGNENLNIIRSSILNSDAILLVLDSSSPLIAQTLEKWMNIIHEQLYNFAAIYICINKIDIPSVHAIQPEFQALLSKYSESLIAAPFYISSNTFKPDKEQIDNLFHSIENNSQAGIKTKAPTDLVSHVPYLTSPFQNSFLIILLLIALFLFVLFSFI